MYTHVRWHTMPCAGALAASHEPHGHGHATCDMGMHVHMHDDAHSHAHAHAHQMQFKKHPRACGESVVSAECLVMMTDVFALVCVGDWVLGSGWRRWAVPVREW